MTHQLHGISADDYELWDPAGDRPIAGDSTDLVLSRLQHGLSECFASGIYPIAFETPHYSASGPDYRAIGRVFSLSYDRVMAAPHLETSQFFPYPVVDHYGRHLVPEDLGYLPENKPDPKLLLEYARSLRVVRDGIASFYFHPFLDPQLLGQVVTGITGLGYRFVSLREFGGAVDFQGRYIIRTASGAAVVRPRGEYWRLRLFDAAGQTIKTDFSSKRYTGPTEVALQVPPGGWAALDCVRNLPRDVEQRLSWTARVRQWWSGLDLVHPTAAPVAAPGFTSERKVWILWLDRRRPRPAELPLSARDPRVPYTDGESRRLCQSSHRGRCHSGRPQGRGCPPQPRTAARDSPISRRRWAGGRGGTSAVAGEGRFRVLGPQVAGIFSVRSRLSRDDAGMAAWGNGRAVHTTRGRARADG